MAVFGYLRVSTVDQDNSKFRLQILNYANEKDLGSVQFVEEKISGTKDWHKRKLGGLLSDLQEGDKLIVPELSRLARSIPQIYEIIERCRERGIGLHVIKQGIVVNGSIDMQTKIMLNVFAMVAELERDFVSIRTREALAVKKAQGIQLGRPSLDGKPGKSKLDPHSEQIREWLDLSVPKKVIAEKLGVSRVALANWIKKHGLAD